MTTIEELEESRQAIVGAANWPTPELMMTWDAVELIKRHKQYAAKAQDELCHNRTKEWAAWEQAASMISAEVVAKLLGLTWMTAFNLLSD